MFSQPYLEVARSVLATAHSVNVGIAVACSESATLYVLIGSAYRVA